MVRWSLVAVAFVLILLAVAFGGIAGLAGVVAGVCGTVAITIDPEGS